MRKRRPMQQIITFKADAALLAALQGLRNRSDFIRSALLAALDSACPLCRGTGILTPNQKSHWDAFARDHRVAECDDCHEVYLLCPQKPAYKVHRGRSRARAGRANRQRGGAREVSA